MYKVYFEDPSATGGYAYRTVDQTAGDALLAGTTIRNGGMIELTDTDTKKSIWVPASRIIKIERKGLEAPPFRPTVANA